MATQNGDPFIQETTHEICNQASTDYNAPRQRTTNIIIPLPKNRDFSLMTNCRGKNLMSNASKVYNRILLNRIRHLSIQSCCKLRKKEEALQIKPTYWKESWKEPGTNTFAFFATFIDLRKVFDSMDRMMMFVILRHHGIPEKIVGAIRVLYDNS